MFSEISYPDDVDSPYDLDLSPSQRAWLEAIEEKYDVIEATLHYYKGKPKWLRLYLEYRANPNPLNRAYAQIGRSGKAKMSSGLTENWYDPDMFGIKKPNLEKRKDCIEYNGEWEGRHGEKITDFLINGEFGKCKEYIDALNVYRGDPDDRGTFVSVFQPAYGSLFVNGEFYTRVIMNTMLRTQGKYPDQLADIYYEYHSGEEEWTIYDGDQTKYYTVETIPARTKKQLVSRMIDIMLMYLRE